MKKLLAISGSLRLVSVNGTLLDALSELVPEGYEIHRYQGLADLPAFNPDVEMLGDEAAPPSVRAFRQELGAAEAVVISSPEYAHGVPGTLKNALDWVVGTGELVGKPVALINPSPLSRFAHPALAETLRVMSARLVEEACLTLPLAGKKLDCAAILGSPELAGPLADALRQLVRVAAEPLAGV